MTTTLETANSTTLPAWLKHSGFRFEGTHGDYDTEWYRKGQVRVCIEEVDISVYVFDARPEYRKADLLSWEARLTNAPMLAATALIDNALGCVRAALLPQD